MLHQLRIYEIFEANKGAFHERFRDHAARIMRTHGFNFVYLLAWPDEPTMRDAWTAFMADEEWAEIKRVTRDQHGVLVGTIEDRVLHLSPYSPEP